MFDPLSPRSRWQRDDTRDSRVTDGIVTRHRDALLHGSGSHASAAKRQSSPEDQARIDELDMIRAHVRPVGGATPGPRVTTYHGQVGSSERRHFSSGDYVDVEADAMNNGYRDSIVGSAPHAHPYWLHETAESNERYGAAGEDVTSVMRLRAALPFLSNSFRCSEDDASVLLSFVCRADDHTGASADVLQDRIVQLQCDVKTQAQKLERRNDDVARLKDEVAEARQKQKAVEAQARQTATVLSQRREETRKQLLLEESKNAKLQFQIKTLQAEVDRLKEKVHHLLR